MGSSSGILVEKGKDGKKRPVDQKRDTTGTKGAVTGVSGPDPKMPMGTANWPGLPGPAQSKPRNNGIDKTGRKGAPFYVKSEGI